MEMTSTILDGEWKKKAKKPKSKCMKGEVTIVPSVHMWKSN